MFAIVKIHSKQYLVAKGDILEVNKLPVKADQTLNFSEVLVYVDSKKSRIGQPLIKSAKVEAKVLEPEKRGKKIEVLKFKAKKRYLKKQGFRPQLTVLKIQKIICE